MSERTPAATLFQGDDATMRRGADLDDDRIYRYSLWRQWGRGRSMVFVMLNPSTADADTDDATIRRCIGFARRDGYDGIEVVNLFALRTPDPKVLREAARTGVDIVGERNDEVLRRTAGYFDHAIAAWGAEKDALVRDRAAEVRAIFGDRLMRLDPTPERGPAPHPLYLKADTPIVPAGSGRTETPGSSSENGRSKPCLNYTARSWAPRSERPEDPRCVNCGEDHGPSVGGSESRVAPGQPADGERSAPPTDSVLGNGRSGA